MLMSEQDFEKFVEKAVVSLPEHIQKAMDNLAIVVEKSPSPDDLRKTGTKIGNSLLGLYQGVPKTSWGRSFGQILPDKITIFREPIESLASSVQEIAELIRIVVWHEIAHHFGFSEKKVRELERKWRKNLNVKRK